MVLGFRVGREGEGCSDWGCGVLVGSLGNDRGVGKGGWCTAVFGSVIFVAF